ncbi:hypothetical protein WMY93_026068 [Mugilogobius chulae]|uniref:Uncharacterized protein n=1 Tax=Mugilogobius chulae TaxID=88201 RepID=A0AAW0N343_9GOBI
MEGFGLQGRHSSAHEPRSSGRSAGGADRGQTEREPDTEAFCGSRPDREQRGVATEKSKHRGKRGETDSPGTQRHSGRNNGATGDLQLSETKPSGASAERSEVRPQRGDNTGGSEDRSTAPDTAPQPGKSGLKPGKSNGTTGDINKAERSVCAAKRSGVYTGQKERGEKNRRAAREQGGAAAGGPGKSSCGRTGRSSTRFVRGRGSSRTGDMKKNGSSKRVSPAFLPPSSPFLPPVRQTLSVSCARVSVSDRRVHAHELCARGSVHRGDHVTSGRSRDTPIVSLLCLSFEPKCIDRDRYCGRWYRYVT